MSDGFTQTNHLVVFAGQMKPMGGRHDIIGHARSVPQAIQILRERLASDDRVIEWCHVYDIFKKHVVAATKQQAFGAYFFSRYTVDIEEIDLENMLLGIALEKEHEIDHAESERTISVEPRQLCTQCRKRLDDEEST